MCYNCIKQKGGVFKDLWRHQHSGQKAVLLGHKAFISCSILSHAGRKWPQGWQCWSVHRFGPDWNISVTSGRIAMKLCTNVYGPQTRNPTDFSDPMTEGNILTTMPWNLLHIVRVPRAYILMNLVILFFFFPLLQLNISISTGWWPPDFSSSATMTLTYLSFLEISQQLLPRYLVHRFVVPEGLIVISCPLLIIDTLFYDKLIPAKN